MGHSPENTSSDDNATFDTLIRLIALELLASCYTLIPASSASHIPLFQQRREAKRVTALRLHSQYRFSPAAGHQARAPSEATTWPGLYTPTLEDELAEYVSHRRRLGKLDREHVPRFIASGWMDGPPPAEDHNSDTSSSTSSEEQGFFSRLVCQASLPKNPRRRFNTLFTSRLSVRPWKPKQPQSTSHGKACLSESETPVQSITSQPAERIPSALRLRRTQSAPRIELPNVVEEAASDTVASTHTSRRQSSNPSIGSPLNYSFVIPGIHRMSATPDATHRLHMAEEADVRVCGRGDLMYVKETPKLSKYQVESNRDSSHPEDRTIYSRYPFCIYVPPSISPSSSTSSEEQPADDYFGNVTIDRYAKRQIDDYAPSEAPSKRASEFFREMYTDKHITHQTDDPEAAADKHSDAGTIWQRERLERQLRHAEKQEAEEYR
jgi:hypothetical protein